MSADLIPFAGLEVHLIKGNHQTIVNVILDGEVRNQTWFISATMENSILRPTHILTRDGPVEGMLPLIAQMLKTREGDYYYISSNVPIHTLLAQWIRGSGAKRVKEMKLPKTHRTLSSVIEEDAAGGRYQLDLEFDMRMDAPNLIGSVVTLLRNDFGLKVTPDVLPRRRFDYVPIGQASLIAKSEVDLLRSLHSALDGLASSPGEAEAEKEKEKTISELTRADLLSIYTNPLICLHLSASGKPFPVLGDKVNLGFPSISLAKGSIARIRYRLTVPPLPTERVMRYQIDLEQEMDPEMTERRCEMEKLDSEDPLFEKLEETLTEVTVKGPKMTFAYGGLLDLGQIFTQGEWAELTRRIIVRP